MSLLNRVLAVLTNKREGEQPRYHVSREELKFILRRGLNTLDPQKLPEWAVDLADDVESKEDQPFNIRVSR